MDPVVKQIVYNNSKISFAAIILPFTAVLE